MRISEVNIVRSHLTAARQGIRLLAGGCALLSMVACSDNSENKTLNGSQPDGQATQNAPALQPLPGAESALKDTAKRPSSPLTKHYIALAEATFDTACQSSKQLKDSVYSLLATPSEETLEKARQQWLTSHSDYSATALFRNLDIQHPTLDHAQLEPVHHPLSVRIDQSPMTAGYLDAVAGYPQSGYVFSPLPINRETLNREHQFSDTRYITLGFHAIEFLLWGETEEKQEGETSTQGKTAATRTSTEFARYTAGASGKKANHQPAEENSPAFYTLRRSQLLALATELLAEDISIQCAEWKQGQGFYPLQLIQLKQDEQMQKIYQAAEQSVSELQVERARLKQLSETPESLEPHSGFSHSDSLMQEAKSSLIRAFLESNEWVDFSQQQEQAKTLSTLAHSILQSTPE